MEFEIYLNQAWNDHATQTSKVASEFTNGISLISSNEQLAQMSGLITHVMGEHLGEWNQGISVLKELKNHSCFFAESDADKSISRSIASLQVASDQISNLYPFSPSDQIRIYSTAASALSERSANRSLELFQQALRIAESGISKTDPANRALAVIGNNLACTLEEKENRTEVEKKLMILAAQTARKFWEAAGSWLEVERAEYRLTMTYLKSEDLESAQKHAEKCIEICEQNSAPSLEFFFAYEALALVEKSRNNKNEFKKALDKVKQYFVNLPREDKSWCESTLEKLNSPL